MKTDKHFKLREDLSTTLFGIRLFRIEATKDLEQHNVKAGDLGGFIETEDNLSGNAWVADNAVVHGNAKVKGNARVSENAQVGGCAEVSDNAKVYGDALVFGYARVSENAQVGGCAKVSDNAQVYGDALVFGYAWVAASARVCGDARLSENAHVCGDAQVFGTVWLHSNARVYCDSIDSPESWRHIVNEKYPITILPKSIQIGCRAHLKKEWWGFSDEEIILMGGKDGLKWWKKWKPILQAMCAEI